MTARILIIDDHEVLREGVKTLLAKSRSDWEICGEGTTGVQAIELAQRLRPDLMILDVTMPVMSGLEASTRLRELGLTLPVLIFTMHESERMATEARQVGAQGYVMKSRAARDLVQAIEILLAGGTFFGEHGGARAAPDQSSVGIVFFRSFVLDF
jgi:DNA-binding NarL/FixJ family response regulator